MIATLTWLLGTLWWLLKVLFWCGLGAAVLGSLFALFHPLTFSLKLRASPLAQRGQFWFTYFFGLVGIGTRASLHHQDVVIRIWKWERRVYHRGPEKAATPPETPPPGPANPSGPPDTSPGKPAPEPPIAVSVAVESPTTAGSDASVRSGKNTAVVQPTAAAEPPTNTGEERPIRSEKEPIVVASPVPVVSPPVSPPSAAASKPSLTDSPLSSTADKPAPTDLPGGSDAASTPTVPSRMVSEPPIVEEATVESVAKPIDWDVLDEDFDEIPAEALNPTDPPKPGFWSKVKALPKKAQDLFRRLKRWFRIGRTFWRRFSPAGQQLLLDLWGTFTLHGPHAQLRYGCHEPHLVGMFQGLACQIAGILWPFGLHWHFVPVFQSNTLLLRGEMDMIMYPWKIMRSGVALLFEPEIRKGIVELWKWYRARKARRGSESADLS
jgi:hypothetical protein